MDSADFVSSGRIAEDQDTSCSSEVDAHFSFEQRISLHCQWVFDILQLTHDQEVLITPKEDRWQVSIRGQRENQPDDSCDIATVSKKTDAYALKILLEGYHSQVTSINALTSKKHPFSIKRQGRGVWILLEEAKEGQSLRPLLTLSRKDAHLLEEMLNTLAQHGPVSFPTKDEASKAMYADMYQRFEPHTPEWEACIKDTANTRAAYFGEQEKIPSIKAEEMNVLYPSYDHKKGEFGFASAFDTGVDRIKKPTQDLEQKATQLFCLIHEGARLVYANGGIP